MGTKFHWSPVAARGATCRPDLASTLVRSTTSLLSLQRWSLSCGAHDTTAMDETSLRWLRRLVTRALDVDRDVFDATLAAKAHRKSFAGNQAEVCARD